MGAMKWSPFLHVLTVVSGVVGFLSLLGAWWTQLRGTPLWGMSQEHLFNDAKVLVLLAIWLALGVLIHRDQERHHG